MLARSLRSAPCVAVALAVVSCRSTPARVPTPAFEAHRPEAISVLAVNRTSVAEAGAVVEGLARKELDELGYGRGQSTARLHLEIESWDVPTAFGDEPTIEVDASLYDNSSGALLWSSNVSSLPQEDRVEDPITRILTWPIDWALGWTLNRAFDSPAETAIEQLLETLPKRERRTSGVAAKGAKLGGAP